MRKRMKIRDVEPRSRNIVNFTSDLVTVKLKLRASKTIYQTLKKRGYTFNRNSCSWTKWMPPIELNEILPPQEAEALAEKARHDNQALMEAISILNKAQAEMAEKEAFEVFSLIPSPKMLFIEDEAIIEE